MESKTETLRSLARELRLSGICTTFENMLIAAEREQGSYIDFALGMLNAEITHRNEQNLLRRLKQAKLPATNDLDHWQHDRQNGVSKQQIAQLRECIWLEQGFNIILMGPSGVAKHISLPDYVMTLSKRGIKPCSEQWSS
jgi:DNA replication protein DnaC